VFLAAQIGDRYPDLSPPPAEETPAEATTETPTTDAPTGDSTDVTSNLFDEIDATAQPLATPPDSNPLSTEASPDFNTPTTTTPGSSAPALGATTPPATQPPRTPATREAASPSSETDPAKLLASFLEPPLGEQLKGTPITLAQAVNNSLSRNEQTQRVIAYWELSQTIANYYLALDDRTKLTALEQAITQPGPEWELAKQTAESRVQLARDRARVAQENLAAMMGNVTFGFMPLPSDAPFSDAYETRYAEIFQNRPSQLAQQLNELLPRAYADLSTRTLEIADARKWMFQVSDARSPQSDGGDLLMAFELFSARRRMFVGAVKEYNLGIVRYTEIATPGTLDTDRLVAMLIRTGSSPANTFDADVQRANAEEGLNESSGLTPQNPRVSDWQAVPTNGSERSILVPKS
jgi:hypothetical protein